MTIKKITKITLILLCFIPFLSNAYTEKTIGGSLAAEVNPKNPGPLQNVAINLKGYGYDIRTSNITWTINDQIKHQGRGEDQFSFRTGNVGESYSVNAIVETQNGKIIAKNLNFLPAEVDLLMEAQTTVPDFYQGAALPTRGGLVKVVAIPNVIVNGKKINNSELYFEWESGGKKLTPQSGKGKDVLVFTFSPFLDTEQVKVSVTLPGTPVFTEKSIIISATKPEIVLYEVRPLEGVKTTKALTDNFNLNSNIISLQASPFYFPLNSFLSYIWQVNEEEITPTGSDKSKIKLEQETGSSGISNLSVTVSNKDGGISANQQIMINLGSQFIEQ